MFGFAGSLSIRVLIYLSFQLIEKQDADSDFEDYEFGLFLCGVSSTALYSDLPMMAFVQDPYVSIIPRGGIAQYLRARFQQFIAALFTV